MKKFYSRLLRLSASFVLAVSSLLFINFGTAFAAGTCVWNGANGNSFTQGPWTGTCSGAGGSIPGNGDSIEFDNSLWTADFTITDDMPSLSVSNITLLGSSAHTLKLIGTNSLTVVGISSIGIANTTTSPSFLEIDNPLVLSGDQIINGTNSNNVITLGNPTSHSTLAIGTTNVTFSLANVTINDAVTGSGNLTTSTNLYLYGDNTNYSGTINDNTGGFLGVYSGTALGTGAVNVAQGASLAFSVASATTFGNAITLAGTGITGLPYGTISNGGNGAGKITLNGAVTLNSDITYSGSLDTAVTGTYTSNGHSVTVVAGSQGSITLPSGTISAPVQTITINAGDNSPSTTIDVGKNQTYIIDGIRGNTTVENAGILKGTGTVGVLNVQAGGTVAPGHSPGCLNTGNLTITGTYQAEIGGTTACTGYDQLKVTGTVDVTNGTLDTSLYGGFKPAAGDSFTIIDNDGTDAVTGTFANLPEGATFTVSGYVFQISYVGGDGNDVVLTVQSVPATPNTGFGLITNNPLLSAAGALMAAGGFYALYRKKAFATTRR